MAIGFIHYAFATVGIIGLICAFTLLYRYIKSRNILAVSFFVFLFSLGIGMMLYLFRGFFEAGNPEDILLWRATNVSYLGIVVPLITFLLYPIYIQRKMNGKGTEILVVMAAFILASIFDLVLVTTGDVVLSYVDDFGLPHYVLDSFIPSAYYLVLANIVIMGFIASGLLGLAAYREKEPFYRQRALLLTVGWLLCLVGQIFILIPALAIANPIMLTTGIIMIAVGILRTPPS